MKTSAAGIDLIKQFEGCRLRAYRDPVGIWTVGYGLTTAAGLMDVGPGTVLTQDQADELLIRALARYEAAVMSALTLAPNQHQFDAMVSLCYNIGPTAFAKSSVARQWNAGHVAAAGNAFLLWHKAGGRSLPGLVRRRAAEMALYNAPVAAAPVLEPLPPAPPAEPEAAPVKRVGLWSWLWGWLRGD